MTSIQWPEDQSLHDLDYRYPDTLLLPYSYVAGQVSRSLSMVVSHHLGKTSFDPK